MFGINCATSSGGSFEFKSLKRGSTLPFAMIFNHRCWGLDSLIEHTSENQAHLLFSTCQQIRGDCSSTAILWPLTLTVTKHQLTLGPSSLQIDACFKNKKALAFRRQDTPERKTNRALWGPWGPSGGSCDLRKKEITKGKMRFLWGNP